MKNNHNGDFSASELLKKLKENVSEDQSIVMKSDPSEREPVSDEQKNDGDVKEFEFVSPVPKSEIEDLDIDELMKRYMPEDDYKMFSDKRSEDDSGEDDDLVRTLSEMDTILSETADKDMENDDFPPLNIGDGKEYAVPDSELFETLSEGGKVCDLPNDPSEESEDDTLVAPRRKVDGLLTPEQLKSMPESEITAALLSGMMKNDNSSPEKAVKIDDSGTHEMEKISVPDSSDEQEDDTDITDDKENSSPAEHDDNTEPATVQFSIPEKMSDVSQISLDFSENDMSDTVIVPESSIELSDTAENEEMTDSENDFSESSERSGMSDDFYKKMAENGYDETDANLMMAFGMDKELDSVLGKEDADMIRSEAEKIGADGEKKDKKEKPSNERIDKEFISVAEIKEIQEDYKNKYGKASIKMIIAIFIAVLLFFYENITAIGGHLPDLFNPQYYPTVNVMIGLQMLFAGFAVMYQNVKKGVIGIIEKKPIPDSMLSVVFVISVIYSICSLFFTSGVDFRTYFFPASLILVFSAVQERLDLRREIMTFNIVSSKHQKYALEKLDLDEAELETRAFDEFLPKQADIFKISKTGFVDGYFRRTKKYSIGKILTGVVIPVSLIITLGALLIGIISSDVQSAIKTAYLAFSFTLPAVMFFTFCLPMFRASKLSYTDKSALVGESALDEYTAASSISFDDRAVFPTGGVKLKSFKFFESGRIDTVLYYMASIYSILGGPLSDVLNVATADIGKSEDCEVISVENDGIEALVDGHHLFAGKADYVRRKGYVPVVDSDDEDIENSGDISIMYLVCDDQVVSKLYLRYRIDPEFEVMLKTLYKSGICVGIKTVDPNINDSMLATRIKLDKYPVRVLKYSDVDESIHGRDRADSGIVSRKSAKALLRTFTLCDKVKHIIRTNLVLNAIAVLIGIIITLAVSKFGNVSSVDSIYVALYQIFWIIPMYLMSKFMLM